MSGLMRKFYSPRVFDVAFTIVGIVGIGGLIPGVGDAYPAVTAAADPIIKGGVLIGMLLASVLLAILAVRFDQKKADDFLFLTLAKSAYVAIAAFFFTVAFWHLLLAKFFGGLSAPVIMAILFGAWSLAYLYTRLRGTGAGS